MSRNQALLLIGPTGSGKTPLGEAIEVRGLWGRRCHHFDFGQQLRNVGEGRARAGLFDAREVEFIRSVLEDGVLLENQHFYIAERLLAAFLEEHGAAPRDIVILNGMPRHIGQAAELDRLLDVAWVVSLLCAPEVVLQRISGNTGGDRSKRVDDGLEAVRNKLAIFRERTEPLIEHYRSAGAQVFDVEVAVGTGPDEILSELEGAS